MKPPEDKVRRVAVTGGSGFIGRRLTRYLAELGLPVRALYHHNKPPEHPNIEAVQGSLEDIASLERLVANTDAVIHCGGIVAARRDSRFFKVNTEGTQNLAMAASCKGVPRFLLISSLAARHSGISPYAGSKAAAETAVAATLATGWDVIRPPAVYGPGDLQTLTLLKLLKRGLAITPAGPGARVSVLYVDDLAAAILKWIRSGASSGSVYELDDGTANGYSWRDILGTAAQILQVRPRYIVPPNALLTIAGLAAKGVGLFGGPVPFLTPGKIRELRHPDWLCGNVQAFSTCTGWQPQTRLHAGMQLTLDWYRANGFL